MNQRCVKSCRPKCCPIDSYAQYNVSANPPSGSSIPMRTTFQEGEAVSLQEETNIILQPGYLYLVDYLFLATLEANSYMEIVPRINGRLGLTYAFFAPTGSSRNTSASGSFTMKVSDTGGGMLSFDLTYPEAVKSIDISGTISVTPLLRCPVEKK